MSDRLVQWLACIYLMIEAAGSNLAESRSPKELEFASVVHSNAANPGKICKTGLNCLQFITLSFWDERQKFQELTVCTFEKTLLWGLSDGYCLLDFLHVLSGEPTTLHVVSYSLRRGIYVPYDLTGGRVVHSVLIKCIHVRDILPYWNTKF